MARRTVKVVLDTNIIVSALVFGGDVRKVYEYVCDKRIGVMSEVSLGELLDVLGREKFRFTESELQLVEDEIREFFTIIRSKNTINVVKHAGDNWILEAAVTGKCAYIVTGDEELLTLGKFKSTKIISAFDFYILCLEQEDKKHLPMINKALKKVRSRLWEK